MKIKNRRLLEFPGQTAHCANPDSWLSVSGIYSGLFKQRKRKTLLEEIGRFYKIKGKAQDQAQQRTKSKTVSWSLKQDYCNSLDKVLPLELVTFNCFQSACTLIKTQIQEEHPCRFTQVLHLPLDQGW